MAPAMPASVTMITVQAGTVIKPVAGIFPARYMHSAETSKPVPRRSIRSAAFTEAAAFSWFLLSRMPIRCRRLVSDPVQPLNKGARGVSASNSITHTE